MHRSIHPPKLHDPNPTIRLPAEAAFGVEGLVRGIRQRTTDENHSSGSIGFGKLGAIPFGKRDDTYARNRRAFYGIPSAVDRIEALGNAVVPQIPYIIGQAINQIEQCA